MKAATEGCKTDAQGPSVLAPAPYSHGSGGKAPNGPGCVQVFGVRSVSGVTQCHVELVTMSRWLLACNTLSLLRATDHERAVNLKRGLVSSGGWSTRAVCDPVPASSQDSHLTFHFYGKRMNDQRLKRYQSFQDVNVCHVMLIKLN